MTKNEYLEFTNLQEHYEWLHAAEERAKDKLETFTTDDSEFDVLIHTAIDAYFKTEIDKAWKQIEEFKTAIAKTGNVRGTGKVEKVPERVGIKMDGVTFNFEVTDLEEAKKVCGSGPCGHKSCPLAMWQGCTFILDAYNKGNYKEVD